jgi:hypothetical protein
MGGGGGTSYIEAEAPSVFMPVAPTRTSPEAMPDNIDQAAVSVGAKRTSDEKKMKTQGTSRLVIPMDVNTQTGGATTARTPTGSI